MRHCVAHECHPSLQLVLTTYAKKKEMMREEGFIADEVIRGLVTETEHEHL